VSPPLSVQQAVIAADLDGRITAWNGFAEQMFGWGVTKRSAAITSS